MNFYFVYIVKVCFVSKKNNNYAYIPSYAHKTLSILGNEKEQLQIKFYKKSWDKLIFLWATKNLKMFYFKMFSKSKVTPPENVVFKEQFKIFYFPEKSRPVLTIFEII